MSSIPYIKKFTHGDAKTDSKLFATIGAMVLNPKVQEELGTCASSIAGDNWYLWFDADDKLFGFCQTRKLKNGKLHIRFLYAQGIGLKIKNELIGRVLSEAREQEITEIYTNDRITNGIWKTFGFTAEQPKRGEFTKWEKTL